MKFAPRAVENRRMSNVRIPCYALVTAITTACLLTPAFTSADSNGGAPSISSARHGTSVWSGIAVPVARVAIAPFRLEPCEAASGEPAGVAVDRAKGWTVAGFPLGQSSYGVYVQVRGRSELGRVEVLYDDGTLDRVELGGGHVYGSGIYELTHYDAARHVALVRMKVRAASSLARINVLVAPAPL
jgi:hypothetical protein